MGGLLTDQSKKGNDYSARIPRRLCVTAPAQKLRSELQFYRRNRNQPQLDRFRLNGAPVNAEARATPFTYT